MENVENEIIGKTEVLWVRDDLRTAFIDKYGIAPSDEQIEQIVESLWLNDVGKELAIERGWEEIESVISRLFNKN